MSPIGYGRMQNRIMRILWERGKASAREITETLNRKDAVAHSTVQTLLRNLERKGVVAHELQERTFVFHPLVEADKATSSATREFVERMFGGSVVGLVAHLLEHENIPSKELERIRRLISEKE